MIERLSTGQRRAAAIAGLILVGASIYGLLARPIASTFREYDERIASLTDRLQRYQRAASTREADARLLEQRRQADPSRRLYLAGQNPSLAAAELQGLIKRAVEQSKGELLSMQVASPPKPGALEVTVKVRVKGDIEALQKCLHALDGARPMLVLNKLTVDAVPAAGRPVRTGRAEPSQMDGVDLSMTMDVSGYLRKRSG